MTQLALFEMESQPSRLFVQCRRCRRRQVIPADGIPRACCEWRRKTGITEHLWDVTPVKWKPRADGTLSDCNARCMGAVGPACDCKCKGRNHGGRNG